MAYEINAVNRGMYIADNLDFLKSLNDECVDLVCIDPPFAKNETFGRRNQNAPDPLKPPLTEQERRVELDLLARWGIHDEKEANAAGIDWPETRYKDFWSWEKDVHEDWLANIEQNHRPIKELIEATQYVHGSGTAAYLCYMAVRLFEIRRVLKPTGSLYLHCDHTANGYLRQLLDGVFGNGENGRPGFVNEIVWKSRQDKGNLARKQLVRAHDTILWYVKSKDAKYNIQYLPYKESYVKNFYKHTDARGQYRLLPCTNETGGNREYEFRGVTRAWRFQAAKMQEMYDAGLLYQAAPASPWQYKKYLTDALGVKLEDVWDDIGGARGDERTGYPTQKPVALAERILKASSNPGDVVLDCFAGCAYVAIAAERLGRQWVACDINPRAWTVFKRQFSKPKLALLDCKEPVAAGILLDNVATVYGPAELPVRASPVQDDGPGEFRLPERNFKVPSSIFTNQEMLEYLLQLSGWQAWCCGFANRRPDGTIIETTRNFHLDHVDPKSKDGANEIYNRAPLCPYHNTRKGNQWVHLADYREQIADAGEMMADSVNDLPNLAEVDHWAHLYWASELPRRRPQMLRA